MRTRSSSRTPGQGLAHSYLYSAPGDDVGDEVLKYVHEHSAELRAMHRASDVGSEHWRVQVMAAARYDAAWRQRHRVRVQRHLVCHMLVGAQRKTVDGRQVWVGRWEPVYRWKRVLLGPVPASRWFSAALSNLSYVLWRPT
jgi:hypothetical protein